MTGVEKTRLITKNNSAVPNSRSKSPRLSLDEEEIEEYLKYFRMKRVFKSKREPIT